MDSSSYGENSLSDLTALEKVKARYLKRVLGIAKTAPSRLAYELAAETFFIEDLRLKLLMPSTKQAEELLRIRRAKQNEIENDFYGTEAMLDRRWANPNQELRPVITRLAIHGFHHKICKNSKFHVPNSDCECVLCDKKCGKYHLTTCVKRVKSVVDYSKEK